MKIDLKYATKWLALEVCFAIIFQFIAPPAEAQTIPSELNLVVVQGEGTTNNIGQRTAAEPVIRVEDDKHAPLSGAVVVFTLPTEGATGEFVRGSKTYTTTTDDRGQASGQGLKMNQIPG